jgi:hypothetical protein
MSAMSWTHESFTPWQCQTAEVAFWVKQLMVDGRVRETPELDGRMRTQRQEAVL